MSHYPSYRSSSNNIKVELDIDLSNYATKDDVKKVEDKVDENERGLSFNRGFFFYLQKNHYVYECKSSSFDITIPANTTINFKINTWKSTGIFSSSSSNNMIAVKNASRDLSKLGVVDDYYVNLSGNHFQQDKTNVFNIYNVVTNIYCVYQYHLVEIVLLLYKMLYLDQYKLLKMLILVSINIKDMVFVLMKVVRLA